MARLAPRVTSFDDELCARFGVDTRVHAFAADFIAPTIAGFDAPAP